MKAVSWSVTYWSVSKRPLLGAVMQSESCRYDCELGCLLRVMALVDAHKPRTDIAWAIRRVSGKPEICVMSDPMFRQERESAEAIARMYLADYAQLNAAAEHGQSGP